MKAKVIMAGDEIVAGIDLDDIINLDDDCSVYINEIEDHEIQTHKNAIVIEFETEQEMKAALKAGSVEFEWYTGE